MLAIQSGPWTREPKPQNQNSPYGRKPPFTSTPGYSSASCGIPSAEKNPGRVQLYLCWSHSSYMQALPEKPVLGNLPAENSIF